MCVCVCAPSLCMYVCVCVQTPQADGGGEGEQSEQASARHSQDAGDSSTSAQPSDFKVGTTVEENRNEIKKHIIT